ncbi:hypothetical protein WKH56_10425 [Priestia sp. SB1]|uniref:Uncharacterized protein n=1 Tax=Priestia aryabhattai TaxID=412384 RepID=A0AAX6NCP8_PRIAR|nr:hypothetical protein [Priestia aryabhattai]MDU9693632.1 hypothetical protein [Priestia aryabhattai]
MKKTLKSGSFWIGIVIGIAIIIAGLALFYYSDEKRLEKEQLSALKLSQKNLEKDFKEFKSLPDAKKNKKQYVKQIDKISNSIEYEYNDLVEIEPPEKTVYIHTGVLDNLELILDNLDSVDLLIDNKHEDAVKPFEDYIDDLMLYVNKDIEKQIKKLSK